MAGNASINYAIRAVNEAKRAVQDAAADLDALEGQAKEADKAMESLGKTSGGIRGALADVAKTAAGFVVGVGITKAPGYLMDAAKAAAEDEAATMRLEQALRNASGAFDDNLSAVNDRIDAGAKLAFSDDEIRDSFQTLLAATGDVNEALDRQKVAMDLSRGAGIPLETASRMLGKVTEENVAQFTRLGITIKKGTSEADALAIVQGKFAGQAEEYAKSTAGQFEAAQIQMAEAQETIGTALMPIILALAMVVSTVLPAAIGILTPAIEGIGTAVGFVVENWDLFLPVVAAVGAAIMTILVPAAIAAVPPILAQAAAWVAVAIAMIAANAPVLLIAAGIAGLIAIVVLAIQHWDTLTERFPVLQQVADALRHGLDVFLGWITGTFVPAVMLITAAIGDAVRNAIKFVADNWPQIQAVFEPPLKIIAGFVEFHFNAIRIAIETTLGIIKGIVDVFMGIFTGDWDRAWGGVQQIVTSVWDGIKGIIGSAIDFITTDLVPNMLTAATALGGALKDGLISALTGAAGLGSDIANAVATVIEGAINSLIDRVNSTVEFTISNPFGPDVHVDPPDIPPVSIPRLARGMWEVPGPRGAGDIYPALLAPGEMVVPERVADRVRNGGMGGATFVANIRIEGDASEATIDALERRLDAWWERVKDREYGVGALQWGAI